MHENGLSMGRHLGGRAPDAVQIGYCEYAGTSLAASVLLSVPHAGREYPVDNVARARVGIAGLRQLEDRHADALASAAVANGHAAVVARRGRAIIDLNRHAGEIDFNSVSGIPHGVPLRSSAKLRGGLGLVPHRYHTLGELWSRKLDYAELRQRLADLHEPYHQRIGEWLAERLRTQGEAVLIDLHSMPPLRAREGRAPAQIVVSDRFGRSAEATLTAEVAAVAAQFGLRCAVNEPYTGGYTLERHGDPERGIHAIQIEIDRALYLDHRLDEPGAGLPRCAAFVAAVADRCATFSSGRTALAAE